MIGRRDFIGAMLATTVPNLAFAMSFRDLFRYSDAAISFGSGKDGVWVWGELDLKGVSNCRIYDSHFGEITILLDCRSKNIMFENCWFRELPPPCPGITLKRVDEGGQLLFTGCTGAVGQFLNGRFEIEANCEPIS